MTAASLAASGATSSEAGSGAQPKKPGFQSINSRKTKPNYKPAKPESEWSSNNYGGGKTSMLFVPYATANEYITDFKYKISSDRKEISLQGKVPSACLSEIGITAEPQLNSSNQAVFGVKMSTTGRECLKRWKGHCAKPEGRSDCVTLESQGKNPDKKVASRFANSVKIPDGKSNVTAMLKVQPTVTAAVGGGKPQLEAVALCDCDAPVDPKALSHTAQQNEKDLRAINKVVQAQHGPEVPPEAVPETQTEVITAQSPAAGEPPASVTTAGASVQVASAGPVDLVPAPIPETYREVASASSDDFSRTYREDLERSRRRRRGREARETGSGGFGLWSGLAAFAEIGKVGAIGYYGSQPGGLPPMVPGLYGYNNPWAVNAYYTQMYYNNMARMYGIAGPYGMGTYNYTPYGVTPMTGGYFGNYSYPMPTWYNPSTVNLNIGTLMPTTTVPTTTSPAGGTRNR